LARGVGASIGQAGTFLSNISQLLTKPDNTHLRQIIAFVTDGKQGDIKENYQIVFEYRPLLNALIAEYSDGQSHET
jgi:hypothetical protein